jgi:hypothetical protein
MNATNSRYLNFNQYWKMRMLLISDMVMTGNRIADLRVEGEEIKAAHYQEHLDEVKKILAETDSVLYVAEGDQ